VPGQPETTYLRSGGMKTMGRKGRFESKALQYAFDRYIGTDPARIESFEEEVVNSELARKVYDLRSKAGLTQKELAKMVGTTASVISRLEDADYDGHSMAMIRRIAAALGKRVEIRFVTVKRTTKPV
ncbi:MAG: XRE family transcriptional regulator, partial [Isosphaeraceae bacterium]